MVTEHDINQAQMSLARSILENSLFFEEFYENFFASSEQIPPFFEKTNFKKQRDLLKDGIQIMILYANESPSGAEKLTHIARTHSKNMYNVAPELYPLWIESLIKTLANNDPEYTSEIEESWRRVLDKGIDFFVERY